MVIRAGIWNRSLYFAFPPVLLAFPFFLSFSSNVRGKFRRSVFRYTFFLFERN